MSLAVAAAAFLSSELCPTVLSETVRAQMARRIDGLTTRGLIRESDLEPGDIRFLREHEDKAVEAVRGLLLATCLPMGQETEHEGAESTIGKLRTLLVILRVIDNQQARSIQATLVRRLLMLVFSTDVSDIRWLQDAALAANCRSTALVRTLAAKRPEALVRHLTVDKPDLLAIQELGKARSATALPLLRKIAKSTEGATTREVALVAIMLISGSAPDDKYPKSTPREAVESFAKYLRSVDLMIKDQECEFHCYPGISR
ncbi:hypothetical protein H8D79_00375, partial [PVC group bacterium]|nr:hypothetical protein [PVC group bacterium]